jgi:hypothetical protein
MATGGTCNGDFVVNGNLRISGAVSPLKDAADLLAIEEKIWTIPWSLWRVHDAIGTNLPAAAADDDLGLVAGVLGTAAPSVQSVDFGATTTTAYMRAQLPIPADYVAGQSLKLRFHGGMLVIADDDCTLDIVAYKSDEEAAVGADLASAAVADNINSATFADIDFTITASSLAPGDVLDVRVSIVGTDAATVTDNVTAVIGAVKMVYNGRG